MTVGRTSTFNTGLSRTIAAILLVDLLPGVKADCRANGYDAEHCKITLAARVGFVFALIAVLSAMEPAETVGSAYNGQPPYTPQYPPQAHGGPNGVPQYVYNPNTGFAPPAGSPPQNYPLSPGALPAEHYKEPYHV